MRARWRKAQQNTLPLSRLAQSHAGDSGSPSESGRRMRERGRKNGNDKEEKSKTHSVEASGTKENSEWQTGSQKSTKYGACQQKASRATWLPTGHCQEKLESGELLAGPWCSLITMERCDPCTKCMV